MNSSLTILILIIFIININSKLVVNAPKELVLNFPNGEIDSALANFGMYQYGHTITGTLIIGAKADQENHKSDKPMSYDGCDEMVNPYYSNN